MMITVEMLRTRHRHLAIETNRRLLRGEAAGSELAAADTSAWDAAWDAEVDSAEQEYQLELELVKDVMKRLEVKP